ncbi:unnamed protein product [Rhizophagus irregularis]|nr:unnamed protein product [Rhizophagus irregularis]
MDEPTMNGGTKIHKFRPLVIGRWIYGIQLSVLGFGYMEFGFRFLGLDIWISVFGSWVLDIQIYRIGFSFWFLGIRYTGFDFRFLGFGYVDKFRLLVGFWIYGF